MQNEIHITYKYTNIKIHITYRYTNTLQNSHDVQIHYNIDMTYKYITKFT